MRFIDLSLRDKLIPPDESVPLQGGVFLDWENQADQIERELCTAFLEERAALQAESKVEGGGRCPHCGSDRVYLMKEESQVEVRSSDARACGDAQAALPVPVMRPDFFPLRRETGRCRSRRS